MSDVNPDIIFKDDASVIPEEPEIVVIDREDDIPKEPTEEDDLPEELRGKSKKEIFDLYSKVKSETDKAYNFQGAIEKLGDVLKPQYQQPSQQQVVQQPAKESNDEFFSKFDTELFKDGQAGKLTREAVQREVAPLYDFVRNQISTLAKKDVSNDPIYKKYSQEVEAVISNLPPHFKGTPQGYEYALKEIKFRHMDEIIQEKTEAMIAESLSKNNNNNPKSERTAQPMFNERSSNVNHNLKNKSNKVYATKEDIRNADISGIPLDKYLERKKR